MTEISRRFEEFIRIENKKLVEREFLIPVKTDLGIQVGDVLIQTTNNLKTVIAKNQIYKNIYLNIAAVKIANLLALKKSYYRIDELYLADQDYGKWFVKSQSLLEIHKRLRNQKDFDRADVIWAKYQESRDKAESAKIKVDRLSFTPINKQ